MPPADLSVARHFLVVGRPARTLEELEKLANPDLDDPELWFLRAGALHDLERHDEAADVARRGLAHGPDNISLLAILADAEAELGNLAEAERALLAALELSPDNPWLLSRYALLVARAGQVEKARRLVAEAARIAPDDVEVVRARSVLAFLEGKDREAAEHSLRLLEDDPEDVHGHLLIGSTAAEAGRVGRANRHFRVAAAAEPTREVAEAARELRLATHPLMWPVWPFQRFGPGPTWLAFVVTLVALNASGHTAAAGIAAVSWLLLVAYSWLAPPLLRRYLRWRGP